MICVTIGCGSHKRMISEHQKLAEDGIRLTELRLDFLRKTPDFQRLLKNRPTPVIVTVRRTQDGGHWMGDEESRLRVLRTAIVEGADYVDLELDTAKKIPRYGKTKRIVSYHNFDETPQDLQQIAKTLLAADPDMIKIVTKANTVSDLFRMMDFLKWRTLSSPKVPMIAFCMGELGVPSRILCKKFGSPMTYGTFSEKRVLAPGMIYYKTLRDLYHFDEINAETEVYGVVAHPVQHSLSPLIHNSSFRAAGLNKVYLPFCVPPEEFSFFIDNVHELGIRGLSITIPHKVAAIEKLTQLDPAVEEINACNTIICNGNHRIGYNTDYLAATLCIEMALGRKPNAPSPLEGRSVMVMGAGGAGMAVAYGLSRKGARIILTDIDDALAEKRAAQYGYEFAPWNMRHSFVVQILANCTPVGMYPKVDECPITKDALRGGMYVFDAVYNPERTFLLRQAQERECYIIPGLEMFIGQACLQYKLFTGVKASARAMRQLLKESMAMTRD